MRGLNPHSNTRRGLCFGRFCLLLVFALAGTLSWQSLAQVTAQAEAKASPARPTLGISPWTHQNLLFAWAKPIVSHIETHSGVQPQLGSAKDLKAYYEKAEAHTFDAMIAPITMGLHLVKHKAFEPLLWVRVGYNVMLVCDKDSGIKTLGDLQGSAVAFPMDYASTTLIVEYDLYKAGVEVDALKLKDQWKIIEALHTGRVPCVALLSSLFDSQPASFKEQFKILYRNPLKLDAMMVAPPGAAKKVKDAVKTLANGFAVQDSIVKSFEIVKPQELEYWLTTLAPVLQVFKGRVEQDRRAREVGQ